MSMSEVVNPASALGGASVEQPEVDASGSCAPAKRSVPSRIRVAGIIVLMIAVALLGIDLANRRHPISTGTVCTVTQAAAPLVINGVGEEKPLSVILGSALVTAITPTACRTGVTELLDHPSHLVPFRILGPTGTSPLQLRGTDLFRYVSPEQPAHLINGRLVLPPGLLLELSRLSRTAN